MGDFEEAKDYFVVIRQKLLGPGKDHLVSE